GADRRSFLSGSRRRHGRARWDANEPAVARARGARSTARRQGALLMNTRSSWDDAEIHAYVDGALGAEASARLEADSRQDPALAAHIAQQRELRSLLRAEFGPVLEEPIPPRLLAALAGSTLGTAVTPIGAARKEGVRARPAWSLREWSAIAATLLLGVMVGQLAFRGPS